jgi:protein-disulfide isomerase
MKALGDDVTTKFTTLIRKGVVGSLVCGACFVLTRANAVPCKAPSTTKVDQIRGYLAKLDNLGDPNNLQLMDITSASTTCFWKLRFETSVQQITVYLSPDKQYLSKAIYDLTTDPLAEERTRDLQLMKSLMVGEPPSRGLSTAPITVVEFSDFECAYCQRFAHVLDKDDAISNGKVRIVFRYFPLRIHPWANSAAQMSECASSLKGSAFWQLHDFFFSNQETLNVSNVRDKTVAFVATHTDLDIGLFEDCVDNHLSAPRIKGDLDLGIQNKVHATPTFFVNGVRYEGTKDAAQIRAILEAAERGEVWPVMQPAAPDAPKPGGTSTK